jgi:hypothetical protein
MSGLLATAAQVAGSKQSQLEVECNNRDEKGLDMAKDLVLLINLGTLFLEIKGNLA